MERLSQPVIIVFVPFAPCRRVLTGRRPNRRCFPPWRPRTVLDAIGSSGMRQRPSTRSYRSMLGIGACMFPSMPSGKLGSVVHRPYAILASTQEPSHDVSPTYRIAPSPRVKRVSHAGVHVFEVVVNGRFLDPCLDSPRRSIHPAREGIHIPQLQPQRNAETNLTTTFRITCESVSRLPPQTHASTVIHSNSSTHQTTKS